MTIATVSLAILAAGWINLDESHHVCGRKASSGYLQGKVVMVDARDFVTQPEAGKRMQEVWTSFKSKPFVLLGSHRGTDDPAQIKAAAEKDGLTYPLYRDAALAEKAPQSEGPFFYVTDACGKVIYVGNDDRAATEKVVTAITDFNSPKDVEMYHRYIDHFLVTLPGRAMVMIAEMRKRFPAAKKDYTEEYNELKKDSEVVKLAQLEVYAQKAKDYDPKAKKRKFKTSPSLIGAKYKAHEYLKSSTKPHVAQEAKNCLADLIYAAAAIKNAK